jgi:LPXTG-site transpeptidase (sortase) family protein
VKHKLITLGLAVILLILISAFFIMLGGVGAWLLFESREKQQQQTVVQIARVTPLRTPVPATATREHTSSSTEVVAATIRQLPATETLTPTPSPTITPSPTAISSPTVTPSPTVIQEGLATRLVISKLGLDTAVLPSPIENGSWRVNHLGQAAGHLAGTAAPGSNSNIVLAGHVTLAPGELGPFAGLGQLAFGDLVTVYERDQPFHYTIESLQVVDRNTVEAVYPSETGQITLITCTNWNSAEGRYTDRVVVKGRLVVGG